jgi:hypothetical protein
LRLIAAINAEGAPFEAIMGLPAWQIEQMSGYIEMFNGSPLPGPLEARAAAAARAALASQDASGTPPPT